MGRGLLALITVIILFGFVSAAHAETEWVHHKWEKSGRTFYNPDTGQYMYSSYRGQSNVELGGGSYAPYDWDSNNKIAKFADCELRFFDTHFEFWRNGEELAKSKFRLYKKLGNNWKDISLSFNGLTVKEEDEYGTVSLRLTDENGNEVIANIRFGLFHYIVFDFKVTVNAEGEYRLGMENSGLSGDPREIHSGKGIKGLKEKEGITTGVVYEKMSFRWTHDEAPDRHEIGEVDAENNRTSIEVVELGKLSAGESKTISPDQWGAIGIQADADDGEEDGRIYGTNSWKVDGFYGAGSDELYFGYYETFDSPFEPAFRWDNIKASGTINSGTKIEVYRIGGGTQPTGGYMYGIDEADPAQFSDASKPSSHTRTSASTAYNGPTTNATWGEVSVQSIVQELVDSYTYTGSQAMAFYWREDTYTQGTYLYVADYGHISADNPAKLTIVYTPALSDWSYRKKITIDHTKVCGDLTDFPIFINLSSDSDLASDAQDDGDDILFTLSSVNWSTGTIGDRLDHEIEKFDGSNGQLVAWVRIPSLSSTTDTEIYMYYGNSGASNQQNPTGVWDSNYVGVWHLKETAGTQYDSTSNNNDGTANVTTQGSATGKINGADDFDGLDDYVEISTTGWITTNMTIEAWAKADALVDHRYIFGHTTQPAWANRIQIYTNGTLPTTWGLGLGDTHAKDTGSTLSPGTWYHVVLIKDATNYWVYLNNVLDMSGTYTGMSALETYADIGNDGNALDRSESWNGVIDEVRISNVARSTDWICTEYNNQSDPSTFYTVGDECDGTFSYRRPLTIDAARVSGTSGSLTDFPVLINITHNDLKTTANGGHVYSADGYDIIFRKSDGQTHLYHEVEKYDGSTGTLVAWVKIPTLSKSSDTQIYMYYGNCAICTATEEPEEVWDSNYKGVWHLKESGDGTADEYKDSTQYTNHGRGGGGTAGYVPSLWTGQKIIGDAQEFDGTDDYIGCGNDSSLDITGTAITIEAWLQLQEVRPAGGTGIVGKGGQYYLYQDFDLDYRISFTVDSPTTGWACSGTQSPNTWYHVVGIYDGSNVKIYINGTEAASDIASGSINSSTNDVEIGRSQAFDGPVDEVRISNVDRSPNWIKTCYNNQNSPSTFYSVGPEEPGPATAVSLILFTATGQGASVRVEWETAREVDNMGFHLYRATSPWGPFTRLTHMLIPGLTFSPTGKAYTYDDTAVTRGELYYYNLEDIDVYGKHTFHGPICVDWDGDGMPDDWEIAYGLNPSLDDSAIDADADGLTNLEEYEWETDPLNPDTDGDGIPDGQEDGKINPVETSEARTLTRGVQILASDETGITLELRTDAFDMAIVENEGEAFERLRILDYIHGFTRAVGKPELPIKGILLDLPEGKSATLQVKETDGQTHSGYWVYPVPEKALQGEGGMEHVGEVFAMDEAAYSRDAFYPNELARLGQTYIFRGQQKLQVIFYPLAFNPGTRELMHYSRIRVRVTYEDAQERSSVERLLMAAMAKASGRSAKAWAPPSEGPAYRILVSEEGIYRLTRSLLSDNGVNVGGMALSQVRLYNMGEEIAISIYDQHGDNYFDDGDYIEFYGRPVETQYAKYATYNVYWLTTQEGSGAKRMNKIDGTPGNGEIPDTHTFTVHYEEDQAYWWAAPGGDSLDRWFFDPNVYPVWGDGIEGGGDPVHFIVSLPGLAGSGTGKLTISMGGYYDTDHNVDVSVNDTPVGTFTWSGIAFYQATIDDVDLEGGDNNSVTVTIECKTSIDTIVVDWFEVAYPRDFSTSTNTLKFSHEAGYQYQISGFDGNNLLAFDITSPGDVVRVDEDDFLYTDTGSSYRLDFEPQYDLGVIGERSYLVVSSDESHGVIKSPSGISQDKASSLSDTANEADYILITHTDLGWDGNGNPQGWLNDLTSLRQAQGLRVTVVDVADIYDEFSYGIVTPQAVKDFVSYAYDNWTQPAPLYVLLVGDSTYDPKNNWSSLDQEYTDTATYLPTYLTFTTSIDYVGETVTDEWFVRVSGDDAVPDMYIGRLPAASVDEAAVMVNKIITYETTANTKTWEKNILLVADNQVNDYETVFETMNEDVAALIPTGLNDPFKGYLDDYVSEAYLTDDIKEKINEGTLVVNYSGHGGPGILADEHIFDRDDVADLTNGGKLPFFVSMSCETGYFADPESWNPPSLVELLLRSENGVASALVPTGMTGPEGQHILDAALFDAIFTEDIRTLGPAVSSAKQTLLANGDSQYEEVSETFLLFGDPAMTLKIPIPRRPSGLAAQGQAGGVALSWEGAKDCNGGAVSGYNLYRSTTSGGEYTKANSSLITGTQYDDTGLEEGTTYYYVVTSVDSDCDESVRSQEASATPTASDVPSLTGLESSDDGCFFSSLSQDGCFISSVFGF